MFYAQHKVAKMEIDEVGGKGGAGAGSGSESKGEGKDGKDAVDSTPKKTLIEMQTVRRRFGCVMCGLRQQIWSQHLWFIFFR